MDNNEIYIVNPVLAYSVYGLLSGSSANVKAAVLSYFTPEQISQAKDTMWDKCDNNVIGIPPRREGAVKSKVESNIQDIFSAIHKLDSKDELPNICVAARDLANIPRSHPEELNNISLVDRLNTLKQRLTKFQEILDRTVCQNMELKDKVSSLTPTYASSVTNNIGLNTWKNGAGSRIPSGNPPGQPPVTQLPLPSSGQPHGQSNGDPANIIERNSKSRYNQLNVPTQPNEGSTNMSSSRDNRSGALYRSDSVISVRSGHSGYQYQPHQRKRIQKQRKLVTGTTTTSDSFRGAPEPSRELFIQRVNKEATIDNVKKYLTSNNFTIRDICQMSHEKAQYSSYELTFPVSEFDKLFNPDLWPDGVKIRPFRPRPNRDREFD